MNTAIRNHSLMFFLVSIAYLCFMQLLHIFFGLPETNSEFIGFSDDVRYADFESVLDKLKNPQDANLLFWYICYFCFTLSSINGVFFIKISNALFLSLSYLITLKTISRNKNLFSINVKAKNFIIFYFFIPILWLITKEFLILFLCISIYSILKKNNKHILDYFFLATLIYLIFISRYFLIFIIFASYIFSILRPNILSFFLLIFSIFALFFLIFLNYELFVQYFLIRFVEMANEASNYGNNSNSGSLSSRYSGSYFYSVFQVIFLPIPAIFYGLYNSFALLMPFYFSAFIQFILNIKNNYLNNRFEFYLITFNFLMLVVLFFGSNARYKFLLIWILFIIVLLNDNFRLFSYKSILPALALIAFYLIIFPFRFSLF